MEAMVAAWIVSATDETLIAKREEYDTIGQSWNGRDQEAKMHFKSLIDRELQKRGTK